MNKLTIEEIHSAIEMEGKCRVDNLLQHIFASEFGETGIDVIINDKGYHEVVKGTTLKVTTESPNNER